MKDALIEVISEQRDELRAVLADIVEDIAFGEALREAEQTEAVDRERIFRLLEAP